MPQLVAVCGLVGGLVLTWQEVVVRRRPAAVAETSYDLEEPTGTGGGTMLATRPVATTTAVRATARHRDLVIGARTFAAMSGFLVLVMLGGYLAATLVFTPAFLLYAARARTRTAVVYTLVLGAVLLSLPSLLPVDLPMGILQ
jgi:hypothetical protein